MGLVQSGKIIVWGVPPWGGYMGQGSRHRKLKISISHSLKIENWGKNLRVKL